MQRAVLALALMAVVAFGAAPAQADPVIVSVDRAHIMKLPDRVATIVIGNPLIADASLQRGGILVITGKGFGETNLLALDHNGHVVVNKTVRVLGPKDGDMVVVYRGDKRETYSCASQCQPRITLGDDPTYFTPALTQSGSRDGQAKTR